MSSSKAINFNAHYCGFVIASQQYNTVVMLFTIVPQCDFIPSIVLQCDYAQVQTNFIHLEAQCKVSWEQLKVLDKADDKKKGLSSEKRIQAEEALAAEGALRFKLPKLLKEFEEKLKVLRAVHRRVFNR